MRKSRRTQPSRQRTYIRLRARVEALEDAISHFYDVINKLRGRVSTLEKKLKRPPRSRTTTIAIMTANASKMASTKDSRLPQQGNSGRLDSVPPGQKGKPRRRGASKDR